MKPTVRFYLWNAGSDARPMELWAFSNLDFSFDATETLSVINNARKVNADGPAESTRAAVIRQRAGEL